MGRNYCELNYIPFEKLDELVAFSIDRQMKKMKSELDKLKLQISQKKPEQDNRISRLKANIEKSKDYRKRAYEQFMDDILSKEEYLELKRLYHFSRGKITAAQLTREVLVELIDRIYVYPDQQIEIYFKFAPGIDSTDRITQKDEVE